MDQPKQARRPQWRGERRAVLVRLPLSDASRLEARAEQAHRSLSETAAELIRRGLDQATGT